MFDVAFSLVALVVCSPLLLLAAIGVRLSGPGPVLFMHRRLGRGFSPFSVYKFRTMTAGADISGLPLTAGGDPRITPFGKLLRKTKVDELPQLLNVLKGEMSIVGPRPEVEEYVELFKEDYRVILSVRPGLTDYAAIAYRNEEAVLAGFEDHEAAYRSEILPAKIKLYMEYLGYLSFFTDMKIIFATTARVLGVS